ncbi:MAG: hypothetical protein ACFFBP_17890 [Promethearchaeota archaeon]
MEMSYLIDKSLVLDPERRNPFSKTRNIFCRGCLKQIKEEDLDKVFKISFGMAIDDVFFPEKRKYYYHINCMQKKRK